MEPPRIIWVNPGVTICPIGLVGKSTNGLGLQDGKRRDAVLQRLMDTNKAARYLGLSCYTLGEAIWAGAIPLVQLPKKNGGRLRPILLGRADLDRPIDRSKKSA